MQSTRARNRERRLLAQMASAGVPQAEMGRQLGLSREGVRQRLLRSGLIDTWRAAQALQREQPQAVQHQFLSPTHHAGTPTSKWVDWEMLECLRLAEYTLGSPLTYTRYKDLAANAFFADQRPWPSAQQFPMRFGSWVKACELAGVKHTKAPRTYTRQCTPEQAEALVTEYGNLMLLMGANPTLAGYDAWSKEERYRGRTVPSLASVRLYGVQITQVFNRLKEARRRELEAAGV